MQKLTQGTIKRKFYVRYLQKKFHFFISNRVNLHEDKATSHTSKRTPAFLEKKKINASIECIPFQYILAKSLDVSFAYFCAFCLLKKILSK